MDTRTFKIIALDRESSTETIELHIPALIYGDYGTDYFKNLPEAISQIFYIEMKQHWSTLINNGGAEETHDDNSVYNTLISLLFREIYLLYENSSEQLKIGKKLKKPKEVSPELFDEAITQATRLRNTLDEIFWHKQDSRLRKIDLQKRIIDLEELSLLLDILSKEPLNAKEEERLKNAPIIISLLDLYKPPYITDTNSKNAPAVLMGKRIFELTYGFFPKKKPMYGVIAEFVNQIYQTDYSADNIKKNVKPIKNLMDQ